MQIDQTRLYLCAFWLGLLLFANTDISELVEVSNHKFIATGTFLCLNNLKDLTLLLKLQQVKGYCMKESQISCAFVQFDRNFTASAPFI